MTQYLAQKHTKNEHATFTGFSLIKIRYLLFIS